MYLLGTDRLHELQKSKSFVSLSNLSVLNFRALQLMYPRSFVAALCRADGTGRAQLSLHMGIVAAVHATCTADVHNGWSCAQCTWHGRSTDGGGGCN